jgi:predicted DNA-binding protein
LADPAVHHFTKEIIRDGLYKDFIGAVRDVELALEVLERVGEGIQDKISATS